MKFPTLLPLLITLRLFGPILNFSTDLYFRAPSSIFKILPLSLNKIAYKISLGDRHSLNKKGWKPRGEWKKWRAVPLKIWMLSERNTLKWRSFSAEVFVIVIFVYIIFPLTIKFRRVAHNLTVLGFFAVGQFTVRTVHHKKKIKT